MDKASKPACGEMAQMSVAPAAANMTSKHGNELPLGSISSKFTQCVMNGRGESGAPLRIVAWKALIARTTKMPRNVESREAANKRRRTNGVLPSGFCGHKKISAASAVARSGSAPT